MCENAPLASNAALPLADSDVTAQSVESDWELSGKLRPLAATAGTGRLQPAQYVEGWKAPSGGHSTLLQHHPILHT